jgi:hypothetical protein
MCHHTFAEGCGSCMTGFQLISACTHENTLMLFFLHGGLGAVVLLSGLLAHLT